MLSHDAEVGVKRMLNRGCDLAQELQRKVDQAITHLDIVKRGVERREAERHADASPLIRDRGNQLRNEIDLLARLHPRQDPIT